MANSEYLDFCRAIEKGSNPSVGPAAGGGTLHLIRYRGKELVAVWDDQTRQIATFLPVLGNKKKYDNEVSTDQERPACG